MFGACYSPNLCANMVSEDLFDSADEVRRVVVNEPQPTFRINPLVEISWLEAMVEQSRYG